MLSQNPQSQQIMDVVVYLLARSPKLWDLVSTILSCHIIEEPISHRFDHSGWWWRGLEKLLMGFQRLTCMLGSTFICHKTLKESVGSLQYFSSFILIFIAKSVSSSLSPSAVQLPNFSQSRAGILLMSRLLLSNPRRHISSVTPPTLQARLDRKVNFWLRASQSGDISWRFCQGRERFLRRRQRSLQLGPVFLLTSSRS